MTAMIALVKKYWELDQINVWQRLSRVSDLLFGIQLVKPKLQPIQSGCNRGHFVDNFQS